MNKKSPDEMVFSKPINKDDWNTSDTYINFYTRETLTTKPEAMTHLFENVLIYKDDPRIVLRGKLDTLQSVILESQIYFSTLGRDDLIAPLEEMLDYSRKILGSEVLNREMEEQKLLGLSSSEIRDHSHNPQKYFELKQMVLVHHSQGAIVVKFNYLRALVRECELVAVSAFRDGDTITHNTLIQALNRLSSCFHILMYKELAKQQ